MQMMYIYTYTCICITYTYANAYAIAYTYNKMNTVLITSFQNMFFHFFCGPNNPQCPHVLSAQFLIFNSAPMVSTSSRMVSPPGPTTCSTSGATALRDSRTTGLKVGSCRQDRIRKSKYIDPQIDSVCATRAAIYIYI